MRKIPLGAVASKEVRLVFELVQFGHAAVVVLPRDLYNSLRRHQEQNQRPRKHGDASFTPLMQKVLH
jgi:hypothetical protein